ncbi:MAG: glycosyl transferase family 2 [Phycisphaerae bacterium]
MDQPLITIVVPVYNEQDSLARLVGEIREVAARGSFHVQIVFVDDGSRDESWQRISELAATDPSIAGIRFRRNEGKAAALMAGFAAAKGELVFMMDADLQDPPEEMPRFLEKMSEGWDVVSGWKRRRHDPWHKVYPSRVFNRLIGVLTGVHLHDHVCGFKCFRREVLREIRIHGEFHRFLGVLSAARGFKVTEIPTLHRARTTGVGKYGFTRFTKGFLDLITVWTLTRYRWRPQHVIGVFGLLVGLLNLVLVMLAAKWPVLLPLFLGALGLEIGLVLMAVGLVGEMLTAARPVADLYTVVEEIGWCAQSAPAKGAVAPAVQAEV